MSNISGIVKSARKIMRQDTGTGSDELRILQLGWMLFLKIFSDKDKELELIQDDYMSPIPEELHWEEWAGNDEGITGDELLYFVDQKLFPTLANLDLSTGNKRALLVHEVFDNNYNYMKSGIHLRQVINKLNEIDFNNSKDKQVFGQIYETFLSELQSAGTLGEFYTPRGITNLLTELTDPNNGETVLDPACGTGGYLTSAIEHLKSKANTIAEREAIQHNVMGWEYKPLPYMLGNTNLILHDINLPNIQYGDSLAKPLNEYSQKDRVDVILANPPFGGVVSNNNENNFPQAYRTKESADLFLILIMHLLKDGGRAAIVLPDGSLTGEGIKKRVRKKFLEDCNLHTIIRLPNSIFKPYATVATNLLFFDKGKPTKNIWYYQHNYPKGIKSYSKTNPLKIEDFKPIKKWWHNRIENKHAWSVSIENIKKRDYDLDIKNPNYTYEAPQKTAIEYLNELKSDLQEIHSEIENIINSFVVVKDYDKVTLDEVCNITKGKTGIKKAIEGAYPMVTTGVVRGSNNTYQFDASAVCIPLVSSTGHGHASINRIHYQSGKFALGSILAAVIPRDENKLLTKYLFYYLSTYKDEIIVPLMKGMANVTLSITKIKTIPILLPSINKQIEIVHLMEKCEGLKNTFDKSKQDAENMISASLSEIFSLGKK